MKKAEAMALTRPDRAQEQARAEAQAAHEAALNRLSRLLGEAEQRRGRLHDLTRRSQRRRRRVARAEKALLKAAETRSVTDRMKRHLGQRRELLILTDDRRAELRRRLIMIRRAIRETRGQIAAAEAGLGDEAVAYAAGRIKAMLADRKRSRGRLPTAAQALGVSRDGPTPERLAKSVTATVTGSGGVRLSEDLPEAVRRLGDRGMVSKAGLEAASRWRSDWLFGSTRAVMVQGYAERVDGGRGAGDVSEDRRSAWLRYEAATAAMPVPVWRAAEAVILREATLSESPALGDGYQPGSDRARASAATLVAVACELLSTFYTRASGRC